MGWNEPGSDPLGDTAEWMAMLRDHVPGKKARMVLSKHTADEMDRIFRTEGTTLQQEADALAHKYGFPEGCEIRKVEP